MGKIGRAILLNFRTKVIVPVVAVMVLLMGISMWLVNQRVTGQLQADAALQLSTAEAVFKNSQEIRTKQLSLRYRNVANEPRFKSVAGLNDQNTFRRLLDDLINENVADAITLSYESGEQLTAASGQRFNVKQFETVCASLAKESMNGQPTVETVRNGDALYDVVSFPIIVGDQSVVGAISFGVETTAAQEFNQLTHSDLILISDGQTVASTLSKSIVSPMLNIKLTRTSAPNHAKWDGVIEQVLINDEHFLALAGSLSAPENAHQLQYLLLSSYEKPLQVLRATQRLIMEISVLGILLGSVFVWMLVRRVTEPLQELHDSVEAVSKGDFSRRIEVSSRDECGELALVFNQMTENLKNSREQLELTVDSLKTTQAQLVQSEKLAGIGEFVSGVAHELNNPLTSVMGFSELLAQSNTDPSQQRYFDMIYKSAQRCQKIVQALLSFARHHQPERKPVCVNALIEAVMEILIYQLRTSNIEVRMKLDPDLPQALVDQHQMQQVFLNIINNARQAIEADNPGGWIKIVTETRGPNVRVTIQDSGPGIKPEALSKIFDPFFTTKEVGKGTGLGLSLCYGIVKEHGGTIVPRSRPGEGATFVIELPITHEVDAEQTKKKTPDTDVINPREGLGKRVLVIDDEEPILQMVHEALTRRGYEVDTAPNGEAGLSRVDKARYDVMLCDWKMPGLNGQEVYERLCQKNRELADRVIFVTGDVVNDRVQDFLERNNKVCLPKPFSLAEFRSAMDKVLLKAA